MRLILRLGEVARLAEFTGLSVAELSAMPAGLVDEMVGAFQVRAEYLASIQDRQSPAT